MKIKGSFLVILAIATIWLSACDWLFPPVIPTIGFAPLSGAVATLVTIVGQGFGTAPTGAEVAFGGVEATVITWSDTNIVARVPVIATPTGARTVTVEVLRSGAVLGTGVFTVVRGVLFETYRDGNTEIYVMNPDGTQPVNLTNNSASDNFAAWSPDGTKIAFVTNRDGDSEIYAMSADGSNPTNLTRHADHDYFPAWSPNGNKIAFMTDRENTGPPILDAEPKIIIEYNVEVFVMNADGSGQTNLTDDPAWDGYPSWSPDGTKIAFQTDRDDAAIVPLLIVPDDLDSEIYAMNADGSAQTRLSWSPEDDVRHCWSPDGTKIAFQSYRDGNWEVYAMNPDGSGQTRLTNHPADDSEPTWSPSGAWITFHSDRDGNPEIYRIASSGSALSRLTTSGEWDWGASWSPDGSQIVFQSARDGNAEIYRMNADGSAQTRLTNNPAWDIRPIWGTPAWMPPA